MTFMMASAVTNDQAPVRDEPRAGKGTTRIERNGSHERQGAYTASPSCLNIHIRPSMVKIVSVTNAALCLSRQWVTTFIEEQGIQQLLNYMNELYLRFLKKYDIADGFREFMHLLVTIGRLKRQSILSMKDFDAFVF